MYLAQHQAEATLAEGGVKRKTTAKTQKKYHILLKLKLFLKMSNMTSFTSFLRYSFKMQFVRP